MVGVEIIASRSVTRRAFLVGIAGMAAVATLMETIAVAGPDSGVVRGRLRQCIKSRTLISIYRDDATQTRQQIGARESLSLPPYFPFE
jgi:hypothetical protein